MSLKVKFDRILGRLREMDDNTPPTPPPDPTEFFAANLTGSNKTWFADTVATESLTVQVALTFNGTPVDADPDTVGLSNWTKQSTGVYTRTVTGSGTIGAMSWRYTPPGDTYGGQTAVRSTAARTLTKVWPAYWGMVATNDTNTGIDAIADDLANNQHRETASFSNRLIDVEGDPKKDMWLWVMVRNSATVVDATFNTSVVNAPVNLAAFESPKNANIELSGYKAYVTTWPIEANVPGYQAKLSITL